MIGRFAKLGVYRELLTSYEFYRIAAAGLLALMSFIISYILALCLMFFFNVVVHIS